MTLGIRGSGALLRRIKALAAAMAGLSLVVAGCGGGGPAAESVGTAEISDAQRALYEEAKGSELHFFVGNAADDHDGLIARFNELYPDIKVSYVGGTGNEITERFLTEKRAGLNNVDALIMPGAFAYRQINDEGFLADFTPEEIGSFSLEPGSFIDNRAYAFSNIFNMVCYNPNSLTEEEIALLDTYQGWTDPRWKDRAAIINPSGFGYRFGLSYWVFDDPNLGEPWLRKLADLNPTVYSSANNAAPQVIAGEHDVVFNAQQAQGARAHHDGAPYECKAAEYAPYYIWLAAVAKDAPHPAAAKLFVNWLFTEHGQQAVQDFWYYNALREGFDSPLIDAEWWKVPEDRRLTDEDMVAKNYSHLVETFNNWFGAAND